MTLVRQLIPRRLFLGPHAKVRFEQRGRHAQQHTDKRPGAGDLLNHRAVVHNDRNGNRSHIDDDHEADDQHQQNVRRVLDAEVLRNLELRLFGDGIFIGQADLPAERFIRRRKLRLGLSCGTGKRQTGRQYSKQKPEIGLHDETPQGCVRTIGFLHCGICLGESNTTRDDPLCTLPRRKPSFRRL